MKTGQTHSGDYFRVHYDPHLGRYAHHRPGWWNFRDYLDGTRFLDTDWFGLVRTVIAQSRWPAEVGRLASEAPLVRVLHTHSGRTWLRTGTTLNDELAADTLLLSGVDGAEERRALRMFNAMAGERST